MNEDFEAFFQANELRIHYQLRRLGIPESLYGEFYSVGTLALWQAYKRYEPTRGKLGTYLNYQIRFRLIELIRKRVRDAEVVDEAIQEQTTELNDGNRHRATGTPVFNLDGIILENEAFWKAVRKDLSYKQWKWVHYFIIADLTIKEIMEIEDVSADAVKGWAYEVRRKLRNEKMRKKLEELI